MEMDSAAGLPNFVIMSRSSLLQSFDYHINPLFHESAAPVFTDDDNDHIESLVAEIDRLVERFAHESGLLARTSIQRQIHLAIAYLRGFIHERTSPDSLLQRALDACLEFATSFIFEMLRKQAHASWGAQRRRYPSCSSSECKHMIDNGYCEYLIPMSSAFAAYRDEQLEKARMMYAGRDDWRGIQWEGYRGTDGCKSILEFIAKNGIAEMVSAYKRAEMELKYIGWDYNHHRQTWFKNVIGVEKRSATNYYHMDAEPDMVKMMVYLTDVGEGDGPFRYVRGSHRLQRSMFRFGLHLGVDKRVNAMIEGPSGHFSQNLFRNGRSLLMQFPTCFIGSTHFGDHLVEGSELSRYLLDNTVVFTRPAGSCILFDGFLGVHAGGNPLSGERLAVQIGFGRRRSLREKTLTFARRNVLMVASSMRTITHSKPRA